MRMFGLLSLLITTIFIIWWFTVSIGDTGSGQSKMDTYQDSIESAESAAQMLGQ